jgi:hypothetical protein
MRILQLADARVVITMATEYLQALNMININARGAVDYADLITRRRNSVMDIYAPANRAYYSQISRQCAMYSAYNKYTRYTGIILTDGTDEGGASHCYGNNIILSVKMLNRLAYLFPHELWHIISRQLPDDKKKEIYAIFDIRPCRFAMPANIRDIVLINPDNPDLFYAHCVSGRYFVILPIIVERQLFRNTVVLEIIDGTVYFTPANIGDDIKQKLARKYNTDYIIGADEVIADNFSDFHNMKYTDMNTRIIAVLSGSIIL